METHSVKFIWSYAEKTYSVMSLYSTTVILIMLGISIELQWGSECFISLEYYRESHSVKS